MAKWDMCDRISQLCLINYNDMSDKIIFSLCILFGFAFAYHVIHILQMNCAFSSVKPIYSSIQANQYVLPISLLYMYYCMNG